MKPRDLLSPTFGLILPFVVLPLFAQPAAPNRVLELDGNGSYVELPPELLKGVEEVTVEGWVKWYRFGGWSRFIDFGKANHGFHISQAVDSSTLNLSCVYDSRLNAGLLSVPNLLRTNQWCHLAAAIGRNGMKLYFNGYLVASAKVGGTVPVPVKSLNFVGKSTWENDAYFAGQIDELRVWSVERTSDQIRQAMEQKLTGKEPGLTGYWSFDTDDGSAGHGRLGSGWNRKAQRSRRDKPVLAVRRAECMNWSCSTPIRNRTTSEQRPRAGRWCGTTSFFSLARSMTAI